jgi:hypothetical protein
MTGSANGARIWLACGVTDMRRGMDSLAGEALQRIGALYAIKNEIRGKPPVRGGRDHGGHSRIHVTAPLERGRIIADFDADGLDNIADVLEFEKARLPLRAQSLEVVP